MTPREKAEELVIKMDSRAIGTREAKNCALIAAGEIRQALRDQYNKSFSEEFRQVWGYWCNSTEAEYWESVMKEIREYKFTADPISPSQKTF
jgi:hypothetical protein